MNGLDPAGARDMRALVRTLAAEGTSVLWTSHQMTEVEELCDSATILRAGAVVAADSLAAPRAQAPVPAHRLHTSHDGIARQLATALRVHAVAAVDGGLMVHAERDVLYGYVLALGRADVAVRSLRLELPPLESLFFQLTETGPPASPAAAPAVGAA